MKMNWILGLALVAMLGCQQRVPNTTPLTTASPAGVGSLTASPAVTSSPSSASPSPGATPLVSASPVAAVPGKPLENALTPLANKTGRFPVLTKKQTIKMMTSGGEVVIEIYPEAAPNACQRFVELVESGFYDDTPVSRVVKQPAPFVAQFGINWRSPHNAWDKKTFKDDPSYFALERGTLAFAKGGLDSNSTQVFINYRDNSSLAEPSMNFTAFGKVVKGMEVVDAFVPVGEPDSGLDQFRLWTDGGNYLETLTTKPSMIEKMTVVTP
jgi:cyclophilin family peptidyl-prolyl cis-trans isomerase